jgi:hypothetical protein
MKNHELIIQVLAALRAAIGDSMRSAPDRTARKRELGRAWDHVHDATRILTDLDKAVSDLDRIPRPLLDSTSR